jgi:glycosyltransferase involved in cell wall biosynthesis
MMKLAVIFESSPFDRKGLFNAVHNRILHITGAGECEVDVYCVHSRDNAFTRSIRHTPHAPETDCVTIDGIRYNMLWYRFSITDYVLTEKFHKRPIFFERFADASVRKLDGYTAVVAHSFTGGLLAYKASRMYGIPYYVTWHGSDIHTHPWRIPVILEDTRAVMENAECNFFVSDALKQASDRITLNAAKDVLYNGVSESFFRKDPDVVAGLRVKYGLKPEDKVVCFAGNLIPVKNVGVLAPLFAKIASLYHGSLKFWIAGDGKMRAQTEDDIRQCDALRGHEVRFWGNVPADEMPSLMNCIDVLVLPSLNEGLPLVCAEAIRCGANVVGSAVGGVPEVIGHENTIPLGEGLVDSIAERAVQMLENDVVQLVPEEMDWNRTASKEYGVLRKLEAFRKP